MSVEGLRAVADAAQRDWAQALNRVVAYWSADVAAIERADEALGSLRRMLLREARNAASHGAIAVRDIVTAAGAQPADLLDVEVVAPVALERTLRSAWQATVSLPLPITARRAAVARVIDGALSDAWRAGMHAALAATDAVTGWRRISRAGCCGACLALADGSIRALSERLDEHPYGRCFQEPVIRGVNDRAEDARVSGRVRWESMSAAAQDTMFHGRGGRAKADLIRSGRLTLEDLLTWAPRGPGLPRVPRETTLRELLDRLSAGADRRRHPTIP